MSKMVVIYWSGTGNTARMADAIAEGGKLPEVEVQLLEVDEASKDHVVEADFVALGCPSMGAEELEDVSMEPFVSSLSDVDWSEKKLALFGSYDWGDGEWMRLWEEQMAGFGAKLVGEGLIVNLDPQSADLEKCRALGKALAE